MHKHRELKVWQQSLAYTITLCRAAEQHFPSDERFGLTSQIRRAGSFHSDEHC